MSKTQILGPVSKLRDSISILILLWIIVSIFIAHWIGQKLAKPIQELAKLMTRYADGEKQLRYIQNRNDEIESVGSAFNYLSDHIEETERQREKAESAVRHSERLAAIGQMAAGIGHEINNPLMNINSLAELIEQAIPNEDRQTQTDLSTLQKEVKRCANIVQGILNFARETEPSFSEFDIVSLMSESLALFRHRLKLASIKVDFVKASSIYLNGDSKQLQQVLVNVLLNAIQASKKDSNIQVRISESHKHVEILILDEGCGISTQALDQLFNPFFSTKAEGEGTGLGLSVSYGIIKKHNGSILIENRDEGGAMVKIVLPKYLYDTAFGVDQIV